MGVEVLASGFAARGRQGKKLGTFPTEWLAEAAIIAERIPTKDPATVTVEEWLSAWRVFFPGEASLSTLTHQRYMVQPFVREHGEKPVSEVSPLLAQAWTLANPGHVKFLRPPWARAVTMLIAPMNVWRVVEFPKRTRERRRPPTFAELTEILDICQAKAATHEWASWWMHFYDLMLVAAYTGARSGGLSSLRVGAVDIAARRAVVTEKGGKTRRVALLGPSYAAMERAVAYTKARYSASRGDGDLLVFTSLQGQSLTNHTIGLAWREVRGGFPHSFHSLKHYAGTWMAKKGCSEDDIAIQLGHTTAEGKPYTQLLKRVYDHHVPDPEEALARLALQARL